MNPQLYACIYMHRKLLHIRTPSLVLFPSYVVYPLESMRSGQNGSSKVDESHFVPPVREKQPSSGEAINETQ